jgi:hypothetical protein
MTARYCRKATFMQPRCRKVAFLTRLEHLGTETAR